MIERCNYGRMPPVSGAIKKNACVCVMRCETRSTSGKCLHPDKIESLSFWHVQNSDVFLMSKTFINFEIELPALLNPHAPMKIKH